MGNAMKGGQIPEWNYLARYCGYKKLCERNGRPSGTAFQLKPNEDALSVNWLEHYGGLDRADQITSIRAAKCASPNFDVGPRGKFAVFCVGEMRDHVRVLLRDYDIVTDVSVFFDPVPDEPSHASIGGIPRINVGTGKDPDLDECLSAMVGDMIAQIVIDAYAAR